MRIIFFGTPYYVLPILDALNKKFKEKSGNSPIEAVVTQPPKPVGRQKKLTYSPVDNWAHKRGIQIIRNLKTKKLPKADVGILASFGQLISKEVINFFPHGILVVHPSLLPEFRGSSPVPAAIITNTNPTGVTIFKMDEKFDHGQIVSQFKEEIKKDDTNETLRDRLFEVSAEHLVGLLPSYLKGEIKLKKQDNSKASFARMIKKSDGFIAPVLLKSAMKGVLEEDHCEIPFIKIGGKPYNTHPTAETIYRFIRAMDPWPGAWTEIKLGKSNVKRLKIIKAHVEGNILVPETVQLEGKPVVSWKQFTEGYPSFSF